MLHIEIQTLPDAKQRYNTSGDWWFDKDGKETIHVSEMSDWRYELLTAVHELIESSLCKHRGVTEEAIDEFDLAYNKARNAGDATEPGDSPQAPYYAEHTFANTVEKMLSDELNVDWDAYSKESESLNLK